MCMMSVSSTIFCMIGSERISLWALIYSRDLKSEDHGWSCCLLTGISHSGAFCIYWKGVTWFNIGSPFSLSIMDVWSLNCSFSNLSTLLTSGVLFSKICELSMMHDPSSPIGISSLSTSELSWLTDSSITFNSPDGRIYRLLFMTLPAISCCYDIPCIIRCLYLSNWFIWWEDCPIAFGSLDRLWDICWLMPFELCKLWEFSWFSCNCWSCKYLKRSSFWANDIEFSSS